MQIVKLPFADTDITIYNQFKTIDPITNKTQVTWLRTVIPNCYWGKNGKQIDIGGIKIKSDDFLVQIPEDANYRNRWDWNGENSLFTADKGDVIVNGRLDIEIPLNGVPRQVLEDYIGRMFTVETVSNNTGRDVPLGHIAVTGK